METITEKDAKNSASSVIWDLSDLFTGPDDPEIADILKQSKRAASTFKSKYYKMLGQLSGEELRHATEELEQLLEPIYKINQFSSLLLTTDTQNDSYKKLEFEIDDACTFISNELVFFELELGQLSADKVQTLLLDRELEPYHYMLRRSVETGRYNLSELEEKMINLKDNSGVDGFKKLYEEIVSSFQFEFELDGELRSMNGSELRALRQHPDKDVRRRAMKLFLGRYEEHKILFTHIFNNILKDFDTERDLRGFTTAINRRNVGNDLPDAVIETLHEVTRESYPLVERYYQLKSSILDLPDMTLADIYAPIPEVDRFYSWQEAREIVLTCFNRFDGDFGAKAETIFAQNRIHAPIMDTKRGGAFCSGATPTINPYVMVNYLGKSRDISTLAHELGHAVHDMYSAKNCLSYYHPILPLAETASVFAEMTVTDYLLENETSKTARIALLMDKIEDMFATSHRQNMFSSFEQVVHGHIHKQLITTDELCQYYKKELNAMFGKAVTITKEFEWEWAAIPHVFEWPFYVYAYNFGNLLVMSLYSMYKEGNTGFNESYKTILSSGSSDSPLAIMDRAGIDIRNAAFWRKSMDSIKHMVDQLESLVND